MDLKEIENRILEIKKQIADLPQVLLDRYKDVGITTSQLDAYVKKEKEPLETELDILQTQRTHLIDSMKQQQGDKPSFVKIAPGAKVQGLYMHHNTMEGDADFINNQGELKDAVLEHNEHIIPENKTHWWEKSWVQAIIFVGAIAGIVGLWALFK